MSVEDNGVSMQAIQKLFAEEGRRTAAMFEQLGTQLQGVTEQLQSVAEQGRKNSATIVQLGTQLQLVDERVRGNGVMIEHFQGLVKTVSEQVGAVSENLEQTKLELKGDIALLDQRVMQLDSKVTKLDDKVTKLNKKVDATRADLRTEIRAVGAKVDAHEARLAAIA